MQSEKNKRRSTAKRYSLPRKPKNAYVRYLQATMKAVSEEGITPRNVVKEISSRWHNAPDDEKNIYYDEYEKEKLEYYTKLDRLGLKVRSRQADFTVIPVEKKSDDKLSEEYSITEEIVKKSENMMINDITTDKPQKSIKTKSESILELPEIKKEKKYIKNTKQEEELLQFDLDDYLLEPPKIKRILPKIPMIANNIPYIRSSRPKSVMIKEEFNESD